VPQVRILECSKPVLVTQGVALRWRIFPFQGKQIKVELKTQFPEGDKYVSDGRCPSQKRQTPTCFERSMYAI